MSELFDVIANVLDDDHVAALGGPLGLGSGEATTAVGLGLPTLLGGMANHAGDPTGANALLDRVTHTDGGGSLDGLLDRLRNPGPEQQAADGALVGGMFSGQGAGVLDRLAGRLGLGKGAATALLSALVPVVLGALGKLGGPGGLSRARLQGLLTDGTRAAAGVAPGGPAAVASVLGPVGAGLGLNAAAEDRERSTAAVPWWLMGAAVFGLGLIIAFAGGGWGSKAPANIAGGDTTTNGSANGSGDGTTTNGGGSNGNSNGNNSNGNNGGDNGGDGENSPGTPSTPPVTDTTPANFLTARSAPPGVILDGPVADADTKTALVGAAGAVFGDPNVDNQLRIDASASAPATDVVQKVLAALRDVPKGWNAIWGTPDVLTLIGEVATAADKTAIGDAATRAFAPGKVDNRLTVAAAGSSPEIDEINKVIRLEGVTFVTGSANLTPASRKTLDQIAVILKDADELRAEVQGHTDNQGDAAANLRLSRARAQSVVVYLVGKGIDGKRLEPRGFGESRPIATNDTEAGRAKNRRVVFRRLG